LQSTLIEKLLQDPERLKLGGQRRDLTVLFSDIRSFSSFSERLEPDELSDFLNEYLTPMTDIVMGNSGMLDKYIGDAVMAVYGAPVPMDDHAERACKSALLMMEKLVPLNKVWKEHDLPEIKIGIGINTGLMSVGNMGSEAHFDYTVMGDAVNLGARLEGLTKSYGLSILTGQATMKAATPAFTFREIDSVRVVGRSAAANVYELCGSKDDCPLSEADLSLYQEALGLYRKKEWDSALSSFRSFQEKHPKDGPTATMIERIQLLREEDLGEDWDGVFAQRGK
jgi:adenylate cyclase